MKVHFFSRFTAISLAAFGSFTLLSAAAIAQPTEPLCRTVRVTRIANSVDPVRNGSDQVGLLTLPATAANGARYVLAWREVHPASAGGTVIRLARLSQTMRKVGAVETLTTDALRSDEGDGAFSAANLPTGGMLLFRVGDQLHQIRIAADGTAGRILPLFATTDVSENAPNIAFTSMTERPANATLPAHIISIVGYSTGAVRAFRVLDDGTIRDDLTWSQRVGGTMRLLPSPASTPIVALLERPLPGVGLNGERPALQMLVTLDEQLRPVGTPERTGFAQFPWDAAGTRQSALRVAQWVSGQGVAIAHFPVTAARVSVDTPRLWSAQPALGGLSVGTAMITGADGISYSLVISQDTRAGLLEGHMAWIPPSGEPALRRNVLSLNGELAGRVRLLPASDGFAAVVPVNDETGFALEAHHVHCELVRRPQE